MNMEYFYMLMKEPSMIRLPIKKIKKEKMEVNLFVIENFYSFDEGNNILLLRLNKLKMNE